MKHGKFTTGDILEAMQKSGLIGTVYDFRQFLDALPEPDDDWQECRFEDIQKGDRVKRVMQNSDGTISTIEGPAVFHHLTGWGTNDHYLAFREDDSQDNIALYRIPAPVQHPDPAEHPYIFDEFLDVPWFALEDGRYMHPKIVGLRPPESFGENWTPADVVPKVVADDD